MLEVTGYLKLDK